MCGCQSSQRTRGAPLRVATRWRHRRRRAMRLLLTEHDRASRSMSFSRTTPTSPRRIYIRASRGCVLALAFPTCLPRSLWRGKSRDIPTSMCTKNQQQPLQVLDVWRAAPRRAMALPLPPLRQTPAPSIETSASEVPSCSRLGLPARSAGRQ